MNSNRPIIPSSTRFILHQQRHGHCQISRYVGECHGRKPVIAYGTVDGVDGQGSWERLSGSEIANATAQLAVSFVGNKQRAAPGLECRRRYNNTRMPGEVGQQNIEAVGAHGGCSGNRGGGFGLRACVVVISYCGGLGDAATVAKGLRRLSSE